MLDTVSARQIQREYKKVLENANKSKEPIIVMSNNKPLGAVIGLDLLEKIQLELIVKQALKESKSGKTKVIETAQDLKQDLKDLERHTSRLNKSDRIFFVWKEESIAIFIDIGKHDKYRGY